jgi:hypothetical protein
MKILRLKREDVAKTWRFMIFPSLSTVFRVFILMKQRWARHVERERRWEFVESFSRSDKGWHRTASAVVLKRIVLKWDMRVELSKERIGFSNGLMLTPLRTSNNWSMVLPEKLID